MDLQPPRLEVQEPGLGNAVAGIDGDLPQTIVSQRGVGDLDDQPGGRRMRPLVVLQPARDHGEVGLRLRGFPEGEGGLHPDVRIRKDSIQEPEAPVEPRGMGAVLRRHVVDDPLDQLHPRIGRKVALGRHALVLFPGPAMNIDSRDSHRRVPL